MLGLGLQSETLNLHDARPYLTEPVEKGRHASLIQLPHDSGLATDRRGKIGEKGWHLRSIYA
jgi:hypothetical protein